MNHFQIKFVNLKKNDLKDENIAILSTCLQNILELDISGCSLTARGIEILCNKIKRLHVPVRDI